MDLSLSTETMGDRTIVRVGGEIDVQHRAQLRQQAPGRSRRITAVSTLSSTWRVWISSIQPDSAVGGLKRVRAHEGSLRLVCNQERILKIFRITGLTKVFPIHTSVEEAVAATDSLPAPGVRARESSEVRGGPGFSAARCLRHSTPEVCEGDAWPPLSSASARCPSMSGPPDWWRRRWRAGPEWTRPSSTRSGSPSVRRAPVPSDCTRTEESSAPAKVLLIEEEKQFSIEVGDEAPHTTPGGHTPGATGAEIEEDEMGLAVISGLVDDVEVSAGEHGGYRSA
ncbi:hypothetical protein SHIRM173S_09411 [Streptomyces hirsutus]